MPTTPTPQDQVFIQTGSTMAVAGYAKKETNGQAETMPMGNWTKLEDPRLNVNKDSGYQARVYVNTDTKQIWFANAGTNDLKDAASWAGAAVGWEVGKAQFRDALAAGKIADSLIQPGAQYAGYAISTSGHSWGETLSQLQAYTFGWKGVGFDGPGAKQVIGSSGYEQALAEMNIQAVRSSDFISATARGSGFLAVASWVRWVLTSKAPDSVRLTCRAAPFPAYSMC